MRILVIGSGGREHAIVRALSQDTDSLHAAPGNPGIAALAEIHSGTDPTPAGILALARKLSPDLVVIGPEAPLVAGAADVLRENGFTCFGPDAAAAMIEGSKSFAKQVMAEAGNPHRGVVHLPDERARRTRRWPRSGHRTWSRTTPSRRARACWSPPTSTPRGRTRAPAARS